MESNKAILETNKLHYMRNFTVTAHVDSGKTTLSERLLYTTGKIWKIGEVHNGESCLDYDIQEKERGITINTACTTVKWVTEKGLFPDITHSLTISDSPGHADFNQEVERALRVTDGAIVLLDSCSGVQSQTLTVTSQTERNKVPRIIFLNKIDRVGVDIAYNLESIKKRLGWKPILIQLPLGKEDNCKGIIDLIDMKAIVFDAASKGTKFDVIDIPFEFMEESIKYRTMLIDTVAESSDDLLERYMNGDTDFTRQEILGALRKYTLTFSAVCVLCGTALRNIGIPQLLDAIVDLLPSPLDVAAIKGVTPGTTEEVDRIASEEEPLSALTFKVLLDKFMGNLAFTRIFSGRLESGQQYLNSTTGKKERAGRLYTIHANKYEEIPSASAGQIVAVTGMKVVRSGDTICSIEKPILLEKILLPNPVVFCRLETRTKAGLDKLPEILAKMHLEDSSFLYTVNPETGDTVLSGNGELHLDIIATRIKLEYGIEVVLGAPQISYRETITKKAESTYMLKKQTGGKGMFAKVSIEIEPCEEDFVFENKIVGGVIPSEWVGSVEKGVKEACMRGVLANYPVIGVKISVVDGMTHPVDSSALAFELAGSFAFQEAAQKSGLKLMEPCMKVETTTPESFAGTIMGDISARRGRIEKLDKQGERSAVNSIVPLSTMFGYSNTIRSLTQGLASYVMEFSNYELVPNNIADEIVKKERR